MAKVSRAVLKGLVKECLVEILFEGLDDADGTLTESVRPSRSSSKKAPLREAIDMQNKEVERKKMLRDRTSRKPQLDGNKLASQITDDAIMQEIFADTAKTTLPGMMAGDRQAGKPGYVPADGAARLAHDSDPQDLFEGASNWATLAFQQTKKS